MTAQRSAIPRRLRRTRLSIAACAAVLTAIATAPPASAALATTTAPTAGRSERAAPPTVKDVRAFLVSTRASIQKSLPYLDTLLRDDSQVLSDRIQSLRAGVDQVSAALDKRPTPVQLKGLHARARGFARAASTMTAGARMVDTATRQTITIRGSVLALLTDWQGGDLTDADYEVARVAWANASARVGADRRVGLRAISAGVVPKPALGAAAIADVQAGRVPGPVVGMTSIPGGCALPSAAPGTWLGSATAPGITLWTTDAQVAQHRADLEIALDTEGSLLGSEHRSMIRRADADLLIPFEPDDANITTTRALRIGYVWLATQGEPYLAALESYVEQMLARTPEFYSVGSAPTATSRLDDAKVMTAIATILDWLPESEAVREMREILAVRWLGAYTCFLAFDDNMMFNGLNKAVVADSAVAMAALAVAPDRAAESAAAVRAAITAVRPALAELDGDGGTWEGPNYWNYQTVAATGLLSSMYAAHGTGGPELPSLRAAAVYAYHSTDESDPGIPPVTPNFADSGRERPRSTLPAWIAGRWGGTEAIALAVEGQIRQGVELFWWPLDPDATEYESPVRTSTLFDYTELAVLHGTGATVWVKGQGPLGIHTHLDAGSVTYRRYGLDWGIDPGSGDYSLPDYFQSRPGGKRWTYLMTQPAGHSTLRVATDLGQVVGARAAVTMPDATTAVVGMKAVLPGTTSATRTVRMLARGLSIRDVVAGARQPYAWTWVTDAAVEIIGSTVRLTQGGEIGQWTFSSLPSGATISVAEAPFDGPTGSSARIVTVRVPATSALDLTATFEVLNTG